jgi:hypothetical protein
LKWRLFGRHCGRDRLLNDRSTVSEEFSRQRCPDPNYSLFEIGLLPGNRLPGRIENEITRVPEQLDAITAGFETVEKVRLTDAVLAGASFDLDVVLGEQIRYIQQVLREADPEVALMVGSLVVNAPEVAINRQPAMVIRSPLKGKGWLPTTACCKPNVHRDLRVAIDGVRIETAETFAIDWAKVKNDRIFDGDGKRVEQYYGFGEDVLAVADGTVVSISDGMPDETPLVLMVTELRACTVSSRVRCCSASNRRTFSMAMTAWSAKVVTSSICLSVNGLNH